MHIVTERTYLPGDFRTRVMDLMSARGWSEKELSEKADIEYSNLSRILSGTTQKIPDGIIIALAEAFGVTTDFLLGLTDNPGRKNYELEELGLSVEAAKKLYTKQVDPVIVNRLIENPHFPALTRLMKVYFDNSLAEGFRAQNELYNHVAGLLGGIPDAKLDVLALKQPPYQADLTRIQNCFMTILSEIKKDMTDCRAPSSDLTNELFRKIADESGAVRDGNLVSVKPEQIADAVANTVAETGIDHELLPAVRDMMLQIFNATASKVQPNGSHDE